MGSCTAILSTRAHWLRVRVRRHRYFRLAGTTLRTPIIGLGVAVGGAGPHSDPPRRPLRLSRSKTRFSELSTFRQDHPALAVLAMLSGVISRLLTKLCCEPASNGGCPRWARSRRVDSTCERRSAALPTPH